MEYKKYNLNNIDIHFIKTDKFKSIYISTVLINDFKKENLTKNCILRKLLTTSSKNLKNEVEVTKKVCELYNSGIVISNSLENNVITTNIDMEVLEDKYTEKGLLENALDYYFDTIFNPNIIDNKFEENNYNLVVDATKDYYEKQKENKDRYAYVNALKLLNEEYLNYDPNGSIEDLKDITRENMVTYYNELIKNANANIFVIGSFDDEYVLSLLSKNKFIKNNNNFKNAIFTKKTKLIEKEEIENNNQTKMVMVYKILNLTNRERNVIIPIFNRIFGVGSNSKLFRKVREENSLCYDIRSSSLNCASIVTIESGISYKNKDKVIKLVKEELKSIQDGNVSIDEFDEAIRFRKRNLKQFEDYNDSILYIKQSNILYGLDDIEDRIKNVKTVKLEEIIELSKKLELSAIYILKGDKENE